MVATAGGVFFGVAVLVALGAAAVWLVDVRGSRATRRSRRSCAALSLPVWAFAFGYSTAVIVLSCVQRGRR